MTRRTTTKKLTKSLPRTLRAARSMTRRPSARTTRVSCCAHLSLTIAGTQVAKPSAQGPDKTKFALASEEARKQSANDEEGFSPDPKKHKEQVESLDEVDKKKKDSKEDGTAASAATDKTE